MLSVAYLNRNVSTNGVAVKKENSICHAVLLLYYVERMGTIEVSISL